MSKENIILGLNSSGFNTASCLLINGVPIYATEEERLIRQKRTRTFPFKGIEAALSYAGITIEDVNHVAIGWNPGINLEVYNVANSQRARFLGEFLYSVPNGLINLKQKKHVSNLRQSFEFDDGHKLNIYYVTHHMAHASSFFCSPFEEAAILTVDGFGEKQCLTFNIGDNNKIDQIFSQEFPHSLGSFYSAFTEYCGFKPQGDEWKLMGASPYGDIERFKDKLLALINFKENGGFDLDLSGFNHYQFHRSGFTNGKMEKHLGLPPNGNDVPLSQEYYDLAAAAQYVYEKIYMHLLNSLQERTGLHKVVIAGGCALNSVANGKVLEMTNFDDIYVSPVPDDSGCSIGAAYYVHHQLMNSERSYSMSNNYLGPEFTTEDIKNILNKYKISYEYVDSPEERAAIAISEGAIIGWFQGRMEFGDRALGNRSILADPRKVEMKDKVNAIIKYRESFRPFAPSILAEYADDYFENSSPTPFMEKVYKIRKEKQGIIPAVTHVDGTGRLQTVTKDQNSLYYELIKHFEKLTGVPIVLNTSFNLKGEPIVCSPEDAIRTFNTSGLDMLIIDHFIISK
jgi:carbamoyltransferase